jgi:hypothetical protein
MSRLSVPSPASATGDTAEIHAQIKKQPLKLSAGPIAMLSTLAFVAIATPASAGTNAYYHQGPWPIYNGRNHQPTEDGLRALHQQDVTPDQAREIDRLYDQLLSSGEKILKQHPALEHGPCCWLKRSRRVSGRPGAQVSAAHIEPAAHRHHLEKSAEPIHDEHAGTTI